SIAARSITSPPEGCGRDRLAIRIRMASSSIPSPSHGRRGYACTMNSSAERAGSSSRWFMATPSKRFGRRPETGAHAAVQGYCERDLVISCDEPRCARVVQERAERFMDGLQKAAGLDASEKQKDLRCAGLF